MGVYGLWRLLDATGKQVPLETLEGKVLAIDISIWIHQVLQGYQDRFGNPKPNAHLIGLFHRICKLLYYKIKPVFVFDGGVPMLKKDTIAVRRKQKCIAKNKAQQMRVELMNNLIKHSTVKTVLNNEQQNIINDHSEVVTNLQNKRTMDDIFKLPDMPSTSKTELNLSDDCDSDSPDELSPRKQTKWIGNIYNVDLTSAEFKALPADVRYEILTDLKETRKQSSWGRLHEMPEESNDFSGFQVKRLLKRRLVQQNLECAEKEMGGKTLTLDELDKLLKEQGITTNIQNYTYRIAADNTTRLIYINDKNEYLKNNDGNLKKDNPQNEDESDETVAGSSKTITIYDDINEYELNDWDSDTEMTAVSSFEFATEINSDTESKVISNELQPENCCGKNSTSPELTSDMLENSEKMDITEKRIVTFSEQKIEKTYEDAENVTKVSQQSVLSEIQHREIDSLNTQLISVSGDDKEYMKFDSTDITNSTRVSKTELSELKTKKNINNASPTKVSNNTNEVQDKSIDAVVISSTDSDSDDFIEIEDIQLPEAYNNIDKCVPRESIQIKFRSDENLEDDMFADIFETPENELNVQIESHNTPFSNKLSKKLPKTVDSDHGISQKEIILEKQILQSSKDEMENKQSIVEIDLNDAKMNVHSEEIQIKRNSVIDETNVLKDNVIIVGNKNNANENMPIEPVKQKDCIPVNEDELLSLQAQLEDKQTELMANIGKLERQGIDISDQIRIEAQELLRLFGIPYIVAPMEAEAQCAYLEQIKLIDGTITDDSDIWLFGGQCVYKNFFNNDKKVLEFRSCDIQHHFRLTRSEMIRLALLVGSDYTTGLAGIGPVTALEILAAFPSGGDDLLRGLTNFCSWVEAGRSAGPGKTALRNKLQNLKIQKGFPSQAVVQAYLFPKVDESKETFTWGKPNVILLSDYTKQKFGWDKTKYDKIIAPVLKRLEEKQTQRQINTYFKVQTVPKSVEINLSKRVQKAVHRLNNKNTEDSTYIENVQQSAKRRNSSNKKRKKKKELEDKQCSTDRTESTFFNISPSNKKTVEECIPQREKDKANALNNKLHAIEVFRTSKQGLCKTRKIKRCVRKVKEEAELSESDSSST